MPAPEPDIDHAPAPLHKWALSAAQITAAAAILTSMLALAVSIYETRIMRAWQQASTQPIVEIRFDADFLAVPVSGNLALINIGQGTAYIEGLKIVAYNEPVESVAEMAQIWQPDTLPGTKRNNREVYRGYLGPGDEKTILSFQWTLAEDVSFQDRLTYGQTLADSVAQTDVSICYCSVFERCWITDFKSQSRATPIDVCPADYR